MESGASNEPGDPTQEAPGATDEKEDPSPAPRFPDPVPLTNNYWEGRSVSKKKTPTSKSQALHYMFYEKDVSSKYCTLEISAMSWNMKRAILSQELIRRLLNTSDGVELEIKDKIVTSMCERLKRSGYRKDQIREIITSGLKGYNRKWGQGQTRHRRGHMTEGTRSLRKLVGKSTWFKTDFRTQEAQEVREQHTQHNKKRAKSSNTTHRATRRPDTQ